MVGTIQIFSIGNEYWGPLNRKKGGTLRGLWIYHSIDKETNPPQATTEMIIQVTEGVRAYPVIWTTYLCVSLCVRSHANNFGGVMYYLAR